MLSTISTTVLDSATTLVLRSGEINNAYLLFDAYRRKLGSTTVLLSDHTVAKPVALPIWLETATNVPATVAIPEALPI